MSAWLGLICGAEAANLTVPMVVEGIHMALGNKVLILLYYSRADTYLILNPTFSAFRNGMAFKYLMAAFRFGILHINSAKFCKKKMRDVAYVQY